MFVLCGLTHADDFERHFVAGNAAYQERDYRAAITAYDSALATGRESGSLYFNLGNACFKNGELARATLNYLRAERFIPGDADLRANLELVNSLTRVQLVGDSLTTFDKTLEQSVGQVGLSTFVWLTSVCFVLLAAVLSLRFGLQMNWKILQPLTTTTMILFALGVTATSARQYLDFGRNRGVIMREGNVLTGPSSSADIELSASPGLVVRVLDESGEYFQVRFENLRQGWIEKSLVERL